MSSPSPSRSVRYFRFFPFFRFLHFFSFLSFLSFLLPLASRADVLPLLTNSARTDLIGPETWTTIDEAKYAAPNLPDVSPYPDIPSQWAHRLWNLPALGLHGLWCYGHQTNLSDVVTVEIRRARDGRVFTFKPTRNTWSPAGDQSYFRAAPLGEPDANPSAGPLAIRQRRCLTQDNVFVCELQFTQDSRRAETYEVRLLTPHFPLVDGERRVDAKTIDGGLLKKLSITGTAAIETSGPQTFTLPGQATHTLRFAFAIDADAPRAHQRAREALQPADPFDANRQEWESWFRTQVPELRTDNLELKRLYYYRWFLVRRGYHAPKRVIPDHPYALPAFYESPQGSWYGCTIGLSVAMQIHEARWLRDGTPAWNHARNWLAPTHPQYRNYIQYTPQAIADLYQNHPAPEFLREAVDGCRAYAEEEVRGLKPGELPVQEGSWLTGAEYQGNFYQFATPKWDWTQDYEGRDLWGRPVAKVIRVDRSAHAITNLRATSRLALLAGRGAEAHQLVQRANELERVLIEKSWDERLGLFLAIDPVSGKRTDEAACYDSFAPFLWGQMQQARFYRSFDKLFDPAWFWGEFPIATTAKTCPMYWSGNEIAGPHKSSEAEPHLYGCSWNGPVWHFSNSLAAEALGSVAATPEGRGLRAGWLEFLARWNDMHSLYGDPNQPCSLEHVRITDGSRFRHIADYFHSAWIDPFMRYWAGVRFEADGRALTLDPFTQEPFELNKLRIAGQDLNLASSGGLTPRLKLTDAAGKTLAEGQAPLRYVLVTPEGSQ
ncbi:MGH1-like glycoside hydrolase domain-containing protein [Nibricoccus sp. IMCC34717]|uniref:MGH1-like glycoside hydrolase domain-containing protein n=1 Tax=Nibricoccus sp. IMCC34717 TaxID=3034021 RepID=UPI00384CF22E